MKLYHLLPSIFFLVKAQPSIPTTKFTDALTSKLYTQPNECSSSLGVSMAFSLVYPSMIGESANQTQTLFGYPDDSQTQLIWEETTADLNTMYSGQCLEGMDGECFISASTLTISNSVWVDNGTALNQSYATIVSELLKSIDFAAETAGSQVNKWVNKSTNGRMKTIVEDEPLEPLVILAINAIYLSAQWDSPFETYFTNQDVFYTSAAKETIATEKAHFMNQVGVFLYSSTAIPNCQILQLPFQDATLSMIFVLPMTDSSGSVSSTSVLNAILMLQYDQIAVALPKFEFESTYDDNLKTSLQALGLVAPFEGGLCIFENSCNVVIERTIQKTFISMFENGIEAAAVTAIFENTGGPDDLPTPILFMADHPFQFFIYEKTKNLMVFEGRIGMPEAQSDSVAEMQGRHADDDFWITYFRVNPKPVSPNPEDTPQNSTISPTTIISAPEDGSTADGSTSVSDGGSTADGSTSVSDGGSTSVPNNGSTSAPKDGSTSATSPISSYEKITPAPGDCTTRPPNNGTNTILEGSSPALTNGKASSDGTNAPASAPINLQSSSSPTFWFSITLFGFAASIIIFL